MQKAVGLLLLGSLLCAPSVAEAAPCPFIMIVLDRSGSMADPPGSGTSMSKWDIGTQAIMTFLQSYGDKLPIGFLTFQEGLASCTDFSMEAMIPPAHGTAPMILSKLTSLMPAGGTNTGEAIDQAVQMINGSAMSMPGHPQGGYIILITDGEPNCNPGDASGTATFTVGEIKKAAMAGVKTFAIGFGQLPAMDAMNMDLMATAGGEPCMGASCGGHQFFPAESAMALNSAIDSISQTISGEFGGTCDDSCYSNGCPSAGQICVGGKCVDDPCINVGSTCAPGDYCYTDGMSPGTCARPCQAPCPSGQICNVQGQCVNDPCATASCSTGQVCRNGSCVTDTCNQSNNPSAKPCATGLVCYQGQCVDDPCRYVTCPSGSMCTSGTGACAASANNTPGMSGGHNRGEGGCSMSGAQSPLALATMMMLVLAMALRVRRRGL